MKKILVIGATSAIAVATSRLWAEEGNRLFLMGRNAERLKSIATDLNIRGAESAQHAQLDMNDFTQHAAMIDEAIIALDGLDVVLIAHGTLGNQKACEQDFNLVLQELNTNCISVISMLTHIANRLEAKKHGSIAVISSVAGDRGRQSNYVYGTAKGAVSIFLQGLRNRLHSSGVHVLTIKPGFVDTPMTAGIKKGPLWSSPDVIARCIKNGLARKHDEVYAPRFWRGIMMAIKIIPERIFKKLKI